jgi:hypothetical protein
VATPIHRSDPADGARDVPLNKALALDGVFLPASVRLEDESGNAVDFELNAGPWPGGHGTSADVLPKAPLQPNTRYTLHVDALYATEGEPAESTSVRFTTGTEMLPDPTLEPPTGTAAVVFGGPKDMCGDGEVYACLGVDEAKPDDLELILRRGDDVLMRTTSLVLDDALYGVSDVPDCVELRRRAPTGKRSAPLRICGETLAARRWVASDSRQGVIACEDGVIGTASSSGAAGKGGSAPPLPRAGSSASDGSSRDDAADDDDDDAEADADGSDADSSDGCAATGRDGSSAAWLLAPMALRLRARRRRARSPAPRDRSAD